MTLPDELARLGTATGATISKALAHLLRNDGTPLCRLVVNLESTDPAVRYLLAKGVRVELRAKPPGGPDHEWTT